MDKNIGIGVIIGLLFASTMYVYNTDKLYKVQKVILYICIVFAPAQWLLLLVFLIANHYIKENSKERREEKTVIKQATSYDDKLQTLKDLHEQDLLTDEEYYQKSAKQKTEKLQTELKLTDEYKKLKSLYDDNILTKQEFENKIKKIDIDKAFKNRNNFKLTNKNYKLKSYLKNNVEIQLNRNVIIAFSDNNGYSFTVSNGNEVCIGKYELSKSNNSQKICLFFNKTNKNFEFLENDWVLKTNNNSFILENNNENHTVIEFTAMI